MSQKNLVDSVELHAVAYPNMSIEVDSKVPVPPVGGAGSKSKYPWVALEIGDSFFVPDTRIEAMSANAIKAAKRFARKFTCRTEEGGVRVWRVK